MLCRIPKSGGRVAEWEMATLARAVNSILQQLEVEKIVDAEDAPNDELMIGTIIGTQQVAGVDTADPPHCLVEEVV
jgi:hypothetical protein